VAGSCERGDKLSGSGVTELVKGGGHGLMKENFPAFVRD
jgi:hypothetical protein